MNLHPKQKLVASDRHRFRVVDAGRRWGKDVLGIEEAIGVGIARPGSRIPYFAPTIQSARDIVWLPLKQRLQPITIGKPNETRLEIEFRSKGDLPSRIVLRGWEAIETERGNKNAFGVGTEISSFRDFWVGWQEVLRPTLTDLQGGFLFLSTPKGYNHFYDLHQLERDAKVNANDEWKSFQFSTFDNPFIKPEEIEAARTMLTEDRFAQEYMAEFRKMEGLVYKEFSRQWHVYDDFTPRKNVVEIIAGVDFGFTNPSVILRIEHDSDNHYWITREWYRTNQTTPELIETAKHMGVGTFYPDPAEPDRIEEMKRAGLSCREVSKEIEAGIASVQNLFRTKRLHVHKSCINTISELESYRYPDKKADKNTPELPVKEHDHAMDALRYALHMNAPVADEEQPEFSMYGTSYA